MTNYDVFNRITLPVYDNLTNTYSSPGIIAPPENSAGAAGSLFLTTATTSVTLGLLGGTVITTIQISNSGSKTLYLSRITGGVSVALNLLSSFSASASLIQGGTITSPTTLTPVNSNFSSTKTSTMTVHSSTSAPSGGTTFLTYPLIPGQFILDFNGSIVVPTGQTITFSVSGALTLAGLVGTSANISWWEN